MTQGALIPYHLRQNKAIERNLFVDLLSRVGRYVNISDYEYISFGGPFLEDFKLIHASLRISKMVSLENDPNVAKRQKFNKPVSSIKLTRKSSSEFLSAYDFRKPAIVWFDYSKPEVGLQLAELARLLSKLKHGDVFKITLNASPQWLGAPATRDENEIREYRVQRIREELADYAPAHIALEEVITANFPKLLLRSIELACKTALQPQAGLDVQPLASFVYTDGQQMLTFTGIVLRRGDVATFLSSTRLQSWPFGMLNWAAPISISVPNLSIKERLRVEGLLPQRSAEQIISQLGYYVGESDREALLLMKNFARYYRLYPWYSRVVL